MALFRNFGVNHAKRLTGPRNRSCRLIFEVLRLTLSYGIDRT